MKCSELWLRQWVNPNLTRDALSQTLTMAGLEVEECVSIAEAFSGVCIGQILDVKKHSQADRLNICKVDIGNHNSLEIVCGASNVKAGMKVAVAVVGAVLPNNMAIKASEIKGVTSYGMLCSASELKLSDSSEGILDLLPDAPVGHDLRNYLELNDYVFDIALTPNRGDCLSVRGLAREISALTSTPLAAISIPKVNSTCNDQPNISIDAVDACPRYVGRIIRNVKTDAMTPVWMQERLRRSGIRSINPIVDVTNYVMLELGQPMHAFDYDTIQNGIMVRYSKQGEKISLLDGNEQTLNGDSLLICDHQKPLAIAGVMGGLDSSVTLLTKHILLESAYFSSQVVAKQRQTYGITSDSAYRFERGVDPSIQTEAIERATQLILEIAGGEAGPVTEKVQESALPKHKIISLSKTHVENVLGMTFDVETIETIFKRLSGFQIKQLQSKEDTIWQIDVPTYRFDISMSEDLIEEIVRLYGYDRVPTKPMMAALQAPRHTENDELLRILKQGLIHQGFQEVITYSFVSEKLQTLLNPEIKPYPLLNPINSDMAVMRTNLWPGLLTVLLYNKSRQMRRIRLFEVGLCFLNHNGEIKQLPRLGGVITGPSVKEQWGVPSTDADFYDLKGHLENVIGLLLPANDYEFKPDAHPALHPGKSAAIYQNGVCLGRFGALHPAVLQALDLNFPVFVFEMALDQLKMPQNIQFKEISKFPEIRRDLAILIDQTIPAKQIQDTIKESAGDWLKEVFIFDLYQGKGVKSGQKSVALALVWQHPTRTLVDEEVTDSIEKVVTALQGQLGAELRS